MRNVELQLDLVDEFIHVSKTNFDVCVYVCMCLEDMPGVEEPRLCAYTGQYYCRRCHWNNEMIIPAHLIRNWDNEKRLVCRASKQFLISMLKRPIIDLEKENPLLFKYVNVLSQMKHLRRNIMLMKCYFISCKVGD